MGSGVLRSLVLKDLRLSPKSGRFQQVLTAPAQARTGPSTSGHTGNSPDLSSLGSRVVLAFFERCQDFRGWSCPCTSSNSLSLSIILLKAVALTFQTQHLCLNSQCCIISSLHQADFHIRPMVLTNLEIILFLKGECLEQ